MNRGPLKRVVLIAFAAGVVLCATGLGFGLAKVRRVQAWPRVPANVERLELTANDESDTYGVTAAVRYHDGERSVTRTFAPTVWVSQAAANRRLEELQLVHQHEVAIDPADPAHVVFNPAAWSSEWVLGWIILFIAGLVPLTAAGILALGLLEWPLAVLPAGFLGTGAILSIAFVATLVNSVQKSRWPAVEAEIEKVDIVQKRKDVDESHAGSSNYKYAPRARVRFDVDGASYRPWVVSYYRAGTGAQRSIRDEAEGWAEKGRIQLHYNPADPQQFYYGGAGYWVSILLLGLAVVFGSLGLLARRLVERRRPLRVQQQWSSARTSG